MNIGLLGCLAVDTGTCLCLQYFVQLSAVPTLFACCLISVHLKDSRHGMEGNDDDDGHENGVQRALAMASHEQVKSL